MSEKIIQQNFLFETVNKPR